LLAELNGRKPSFNISVTSSSANCLNGEILTVKGLLYDHPEILQAALLKMLQAEIIAAVPIYSLLPSGVSPCCCELAGANCGDQTPSTCLHKALIIPSVTRQLLCSPKR
uniref:Uncharacterized protein n=1 Tax=Strigops habroptila TaxID=2489341 RepID=A0A672UC06_STRHB